MLRKILPLAVIGLTLAMATGYGPELLRLQTPGADAEWADLEYGKEWAAYLAPKEACPGGETVEASVAEQQVTVLCMLNWARTKRGPSSASNVHPAHAVDTTEGCRSSTLR